MFGSSPNPCFMTLRSRSTTLLLALAGVLSLAPVSVVYAQGSVDPSVAPRAVMLERQGDRTVATQMLGRYLATAPDDGVAWLHLGRFYLADERDWHLRGHVGDPPGIIYLDFSATALDQSLRLLVDSAIVFRWMVEMDRARVFVESFGWDAARERRPREPAPPMPPYILELGVNLLSSCPANGVLLTGSDLETVAVWYASLETSRRSDVLPLDPRIYTTDSLYRAQIATSLEVDPALPVRQALGAVAARRPVCLTPMADTAAVPFTNLVPVRLVRVHAVSTDPTSDVLSVTDLIQTERVGGTVWTVDVRRIYAAAAHFNALLCGGLLAPLGDRPLGACGH
jgi:hypothetical protein